MNKPYKIIDVEQDTPEWHKLRSNRIGGSDAPSIMGVGYSTPHQLWLEKVGAVKREQTEAMRYGKKKEAEIRQWVSDKMQIEFKPAVVESLELPLAIASLDGLSANGNCAIEIKCSNGDDHKQAFYRKPPCKYKPQLQHQMMCLGLEFVLYVSFYQDDYIMFPVERDDDFIKDMLIKEKEFYENLINFTPPSLIDKDYRDESHDLELVSDLSRVKDIRTQIKMLEGEEKKLRDNIIGKCSNGNIRANSHKVTKVISKGRIEYDQVKELNGVDLDRYRKENAVSWRIS